MRHLATTSALLGALAVAGWAGAAHARNPHCAGGIQYVVQGMRDKDKGNMEDYQRQLAKAVQQLEICSAEDPNDFEAIGYLGWAYAEVDSMKPAGEAFTRAIAGLESKGDKKKAELVKNNLESFWATSFNKGIEAINSAQAAYPDFTKDPADDADKNLKAEAGKKYAEARVHLNRAAALKPQDVRTIRNLGSVEMFQGNWAAARERFKQGLALAPNDSVLKTADAAAVQNEANALIRAGKNDEAATLYTKLIAADPKNADLYLGLAEAHFKRATSLEGEARRPVFRAAADAYAKAAELSPSNADLPFNSALAYQNANEWALAIGMWDKVLAIRPSDVEAMSAKGQALSELKRNDEAVKVVHAAVTQDPKNKVLHRQLGAVYTKAGNSAKATQELMMYLAMNSGKPVEDAAAHSKKAPAGSDAAKLAATGAPEQILLWEADGKNYETWIYWDKKIAHHFSGHSTQLKSDWNAPDTKTSSK